MLDQLAAYGRFHRLHQESVTVAEVTQHSTLRLPVAEPRFPARPRPRSGIAAAAVVAAVLVIAGIVLLQEAGETHVRTKPAAPGIFPSTFAPRRP